MSNAKDIVEVASDVYKLLKPLETEDRSKVVKAAFALLGETSVPPVEPSVDLGPSDTETNQVGVHARAHSWMKKANISPENLGQVFHVEGGAAEFIAGEMPGKSVKNQVINAYILTGIGNLLISGEPKFSDEDARELCKTHGILDVTNHSKYMKEKGNTISGSKSAGWVITAPGLKMGAELVRGLAQN